MAKYLDYDGLQKYHSLLNDKIDAITSEQESNTIYHPADTLSDTLAMTEKHGGLDKKTVAYFRENQMTHDQLFDAILFPTLQPTASNPSITLKYQSSVSKTIEVGSKLPSKDSFYSTINRGSVTYGTTAGDNYYAGEAGDVTYTIGGGDTLWETVSECKSYEVKCSTTLADGAQPLDNKGGNATISAYSSGTVTDKITINACYNVYATTVSVGTLTKQTLRTKSGWNGQVLKTVAENDGEVSVNKFRIDVPSGWTVSAKQENPNKVNVYDVAVDLTKVGTTTYKDANNADVTYDIWVRTSDEKNTLTEGVNIKLTIS